MTPHEGEIGRYRIVRRVGSGGMAWTFLCTLEGIGGFQKYVVIKMLDPERVHDSRYINMFLDEARLWAKFNHPSIPQAFELSTFNNIPYTVLEYVPGPTLHLLARTLGARSIQDYYRIAKIGADIARALDYAYYGTSSDGLQFKVIHRDVTLNNILLSTSGRPCLIDFGIALAEERLTHTEVGTFKGRIQYMAPEQLLEQTLDHRTDLFQLGITLYRLVTGQPAYSRENQNAAAQWKMRMSGGVAPLTDLAPDCPPRIAALIEQCIQPDMEARPARGAKLADALEAAIAEGSPRPVDAADLADWVGALFPHQEWMIANPETGAIQSGQLTSLGSGFSGSGPFGTGATPVAAVPPSRSQIAIFATLIGGLGLSLLLITILSGLLVATQIFQSDPLQDESADPNRAALVYLDEVDRLIQIDRYRDAGVFLLKARAVNPTNPELVVRLSRTSSAVQDKLLLAAAEQAFAENDLDLAAQRAGEMLDIEPTNPEALALLARVSDVRERATKTTDPVALGGTLSITSQPPGRVFIDDHPRGATPLDDLALPAGQHTVYVRLAGYTPLKKTITIKSRELLALNLTLEPLAEETQAASDNRISSLVAAVSPETTDVPPEPAPGIEGPSTPDLGVAPSAPGTADPVTPEPEAAPATLPGSEIQPDRGVADATQPVPVLPAPIPQGTASEMKSDVPVAKQALVLMRALSFDSKLSGRVGSKLVIASLYTDATTKKRALRMNVEISHTEMQIQGKSISTVSTEFTTGEALAAAISAQGIDVLYIPTGMDAQLAQIVKVAREANVLTIGAEPGYVRAGLSIGVFNKDDNTVIGLNQGAASAEGAQFTGEILQLAVPLN